MARYSVILPVVLLPLLLAGCKDRNDAAANPSDASRPVLVQRVAYVDRTPRRSFVATIRPRVESDLGFRVAGKVSRRLANVGDRVRIGQLLATLDEVDLKLQVDQAVAERSAARESLAQAEADLHRTLTLAGQGWTAVAASDRQKAVTEEARGRMLRAERALSLAQNALSYASLAADADGVVTATGVEPGQVVSAGQLAVRLAHSAEKEAVVAVPEAVIEEARAGRAELTLWSDPGATHRAVLRELAPAADAATRTFLARFSLPDTPVTAQLGMTGTLTLADARAQRVARLPLSALFDQGHGPAVWRVADDGSLSLEAVKVAAYESREVLIASGVTDGDAVATLGVQKLDPGQHVHAVESLQF